ncbi:uncharacterized protein LOC144422243 [Styela clava]
MYTYHVPMSAILVHILLELLTNLLLNLVSNVRHYIGIFHSFFIVDIDLGIRKKEVYNELEEDFRVAVRLIPDQSEWNSFIKDGLKIPVLNTSATNDERMKDLRRWKRIREKGATSDNFILIIREHFKKDSSLVQAFSHGFEKIADAIKKGNIPPPKKTTNLGSVTGDTVMIGNEHVHYYNH